MKNFFFSSILKKKKKFDDEQWKIAEMQFDERKRKKERFD